MKKILILGSTGMVGKSVTRAFKNKHKIIEVSLS